MLIDVAQLKKTYITEDLTVPVLHGIDLQIDTGDFVAIMGPSGSGKSTLMHIISFLDTSTGGTYKFEGEDVSTLSPDELASMRNKKIGFVFQSFNLLPRTSVYDNVALPLLYTKDKTKGEADILAAIDAVGLSHRKDNLSNQLSGGEKQRVAIARAIVNDPEIVFADEPTGNLDTKTGNEIMKIMQNLNNEGRTVIMVTHEQSTASYAKRIIKLRDGVIESSTAVIKRAIAMDGVVDK